MISSAKYSLRENSHRQMSCVLDEQLLNGLLYCADLLLDL